MFYKVLASNSCWLALETSRSFWHQVAGLFPFSLVMVNLSPSSLGHPKLASVQVDLIFVMSCWYSQPKILAFFSFSLLTSEPFLSISFFFSSVTPLGVWRTLNCSIYTILECIRPRKATCSSPPMPIHPLHLSPTLDTKYS